MNQRVKRMTTITMLLAMSILFHMIEAMIPIPLPVPGVKLGFANIVGLIAYYLFGFKVMIGMNLTRVIIASLLRGTLFGTAFWLSMGGVLLSSLAMAAFAKGSKMTVIGVSMACATFHCIGQILVAMGIINTVLMIYYLPIMLILSIPTGIFTGVVAKQVLQRMGSSKKWNMNKK